MQDALPGSGQEADYASVDDALPEGKLHRIKSTSKKNEKGGCAGFVVSILVCLFDSLCPSKFFSVMSG